MKTLNEKGLTKLTQIINDYVVDDPSREIIEVWVRDIEHNLNEGHYRFEIRSSESKTKRTETFYFDDDEIEEEEDPEGI